MSRSARDPETRRRQLLEAARELFLEQGFADTSVAAIVRRVGVAQGTFYYHFPSKEAIGDGVIDEWIGAIHGGLEAALARPADPVERLRGVLAALRRVMDEQRAVIASLQLPANEKLHARFAERFGARLLALFQQLVEQGVASGQFSVEHPRETLQLLLAALARLTRAHHPGARAASLARLHAAAETLFLRALGVAPDPDHA